MYIHKLRKSTTGMGGSVSALPCKCGGGIARPHRRTTGSGLRTEVFEPTGSSKATEILRNIKVSKPRVQIGRAHV